MNWVLIKKAAEEIGYTENAIRQKLKKGVWIHGHHWLKAPDGRILIHLGRIIEWIEGKQTA